MQTTNTLSIKENTMFTNTSSLNLTSTVTEVVQVPSKENNYTAVVQAEQSTAQGTIKDFGSASSEHSKTEDPKELLELAREEAKESQVLLPMKAVIIQVLKQKHSKITMLLMEIFPYIKILIFMNKIHRRNGISSHSKVKGVSKVTCQVSL